ncbi:hypothetical protein A3K73_05535 [Candidatus Pacearchaeota archaeon RBG_13_36_9]|nr:MAG: hypothetical protein A3K73_05535 [Candidatus Pacearchaeota archaeon RBG_13_36_9]HJX50129.1 FAD-dependent oxidoreductase [Candidatus Nanoarchaeia archaeon]
MYDYDVIIIGAGIAGTGLSYNLKREGYKGSILIIDKKSPGSNAPFVYRNTFKEIIDEYKLTYEHKFDGAVIGIYGETNKLKENFFFIDYKKVCNFLLKNSDALFKKENALEVKDKVLITDKNKYKFGYLIDCSGASFFLRRLYKLPLPFRYWIGNIKVLKNKVDIGNYFYFCVSRDKVNYLEDFYPTKDKVIHGDWVYENKIDFNLIKVPKDTLYNKIIKNPKITKQEKAIIPSSPVLPLVIKNCAFLGDSFGNASSSVSEGIRPILDTSIILARAINKNNLKSYEKEWNKKNLNLYIKKLSLKLSSKLKVKLLHQIRKNPELLKKMMKNEDTKIPKNIKNKIPINLKLRVIMNYLFLASKYKIMRLRY